MSYPIKIRWADGSIEYHDTIKSAVAGVLHSYPDARIDEAAAGTVARDGARVVAEITPRTAADPK